MKRLREFKTYAEFENRRRQHPMKGAAITCYSWEFNIFLASASKNKKRAAPA